MNQSVYDKLERFALFVREQSRLLSQQVRPVSEQALVHQLATEQRLSKLFRQMSQLEALFAESYASSSELLEEGNAAPVNFIQKAQMRVCERFQDLVSCYFQR